MAEQVFIGLGSNVGDDYGNCARAIREILNDRRAEFLALSSLYYTSPLSVVPQRDILNGVLSIAWRDTASELLSLLLSIEEIMGRVRQEPDGPRTIDLDILLFDKDIIDLPGLIIPHPRLHLRKFVLLPCLEIAPSLVHPVLLKRFDDLLASIGDEQRISFFSRVRQEDIMPPYDDLLDRVLE